MLLNWFSDEEWALLIFVALHLSIVLLRNVTVVKKGLASSLASLYWEGVGLGWNFII